MIRYHARWVIPITAGPIENGTVVEDSGRIVYAGARGDAPPGEDRDLGDVALLPGLVNAHTHLELTAMRGLLEDLAFDQWIARMRERREWLLSGTVAQVSARWGVVEGLRCGTTTFADTSPSGASALALAESGVRGVVYQEAFGPDPDDCERAVEELRDRIAQLRAHRRELVSIGVSPHAPYTVSDRLFAAVAALAREEGLALAVHVAESAAEMELVCRGAGAFADSLEQRNIPVAPRAPSPIELLRATGVLGPHTLLIHCVHLSAEDVSIVSRSGAAVAHCPVSNAKLGHGVAPVLELLDAGVPVALGSDSVASNNRMDLLDEARVAVLLQRASTARFDALTATSALEMATLGGARALGLADRIGSLEPGKEADLAAFALDGTVPAGDIQSALIFSLYDRGARFVAVAGRVLVDEGRVLDEPADLRARVAAAAEGLSRLRTSNQA